MSNNSELHAAILNECRDTAAKEHGFVDYLQIDMTDHEPSERTDFKLSIEKRAALLAMAKLEAFYEWAAGWGWNYYPILKKWHKQSFPPALTTTELYQKYQESLTKKL